MRSMTSYAKKEVKAEWGYASWELRSVNHRYFDASFKMQDNFNSWEPSWRALLNHFIHRGKVECNLYFKPSPMISPQLDINIDLVNKLKLAGEAVSDILTVDPQWSIKEVLAWPNVIQPVSLPVEILKEPLTNLLEEAINDFIEARHREGSNIHKLIQDRLSQISEQLKQVSAQLPEIVMLYREKMMKGLDDIEQKQTMDSNRFEQEMVYFMQRIDVAEEIDRLASHVSEVTRVMQLGENIGRRLDFLMQEMNREANTLASKSCHELTTKCAVELKVLIEQMREQIQNVE